MSTIHDVARTAGVSIATVSRVLNNSPHKVNSETRQRVMKVIKDLDYHPNALAKSLLNKKTMTIGIIVPDISNPYYAEIVRGIQDIAEPLGYSVLLLNTDRTEEKTIKHIRLLREKHVEGVIFCGGSFKGETSRNALSDLGRRTVVIGRQEADFPSVRIDNAEAAYRAVEYLADLGHKTIAFLGGPMESTTMADRYSGFLKGVKDFSLLQYPGLTSFGNLTIERGYLTTKAFLANIPRPTALLSVNDQMLFGSVKAAADSGVRVPDDLSLIGFDNIELSGFTIPSFTTIDVPRYQMGRAAMELLRDLINGKPVSPIKWFDTVLIQRDSTSHCLNSTLQALSS